MVLGAYGKFIERYLYTHTVSEVSTPHRKLPKFGELVRWSRSSSGIKGDVQSGSLEHEQIMVTCGKYGEVHDTHATI